MAIKFYQTLEFKKIELIWNAKLANSGFIDAEKTVGNIRTLKQNAANSYRQAIKENRESKIAYYQAIARNIHATAFDKSLDRAVMMRFADGQSVAKIERDLKAAGTSVHHETIRFIIRRYEHKWGIRFWTAKQRNLKRG